jgi:hypothetical protein
MATSEIPDKVLKIIAVLLLLSAVSLLAVIPAILLDKSSGSMPIQAASGALIGMILHLFAAYWLGIWLRKRRAGFRKEIYFLLALALFFLGFMMLDGAYAFLDDVIFVSVGMFICASFDFAASLVSIIALVLLWTKKKS